MAHIDEQTPAFEPSLIQYMLQTGWIEAHYHRQLNDFFVF
jgi:hypothetical protein